MKTHKRLGRISAIVALTTAIAISSTNYAEARQLTPDESVALAGQTLPAIMHHKSMTTTQPTEYRLLRTFNRDNLNTVYVIQNPSSNQVLFLSADDCAKPVLGWCDAESFDINKLPPALTMMLQTYSHEIAAASNTGIASDIHIQASNTERTDIAPLMTSRWNQNSPYNDLCPAIDGTNAPTGCTATAMAQIINYHQWPSTGVGEYSYTWSGQTLSFDYASTTFDYSKMLDYYNSTATTEQKTAVAQLMYGCGVTAQMNYALSGSGASLNNAGVGMMRNFDYAASMNRIFRDHYEINDWLNILYDELSNQRPILYAGYTESGGHAFVLDGFKADGNYFHVNWGWGGDSDGYYVITALNPGSQGIGGSSSGDGFNYSQEALIGIEKNYDGAESGYYCYVGGDFVVDKTEYTRSETVRFLEVSGGYLGNGGLSTIKMAYGVKLTNSDTGEVTYLHGNEVEMPSGYGWARYWFNASEFPSTGNYIVEPSALVNGEYGIVHTDIFSVRALKMTATESKLIFSAIEEDSGLTATNLQVLSTPYVGANLELSVDITNEGIEYYDNVYPILMVGDSIAAEFDGERIDLPRGSSTTLKLAYTIPTTITAGDYTLYMCDANGRKISSPVSVTISEAPDGTASLAITGFTCPGSYGGSGTTQLDPALIDATNFKLDVDVTNSGTGIYRNVVYAFVYNLSGGGSLAYIGYGLYQINPGESKTMSFSNDISSGLTIGTTYFVALFYYPDSDGAFFNNYFFIQPIDTTAGIETVDSDNDGNSVNVSVSGSEIGITSQADIEQVRIYNTTGKLVRSEQLRTSATDVSINAEGLTHGIYLVQVQTSTGITTVKVTI